MRVEHLALNLPHPRKWVAWYVQHCGFRIARAMTAPPWTIFLADSLGHALMEVYDRPDKPRLEFPTTDPILFHLALASEDLVSDTCRLTAAGATHLEGAPDADGFGLIMLRDPWGIPLQLCRRRDPFVLTSHPPAAL